MTSSLVGSEMCIRDRDHVVDPVQSQDYRAVMPWAPLARFDTSSQGDLLACLLYTSDAADDM
eukprot:2091526-Prorocentrum_lima.AAC.1